MIKTKLNKLKNMSEIIRKININGVDYNISPIASEEQLGMVKLGPGLDINDDGTTVVSGKDGIVGDISKGVMVDEEWLKNYLDTNFDFSDNPQDNLSNYFKIISLEDNSTISLPTNTSPNLMYSLNGIDWTQWDYSIIQLNNGDILYLKGNNNGFSTSTSKYNNFNITGKVELAGNIMSLLYGDNFENNNILPGNYTFYKLFYNCTGIVSAKDLILPATTLANNCYLSMFQGCTSLTTAPELKATTLANNCYLSMFQGCTSLTTTPKLPATTLAQGCYHSMFSDCTSLTETPELLATTLADSCYYYMFEGCYNLSKITMLATDISAANCLGGWVYGVASGGTFIKAPISIESGISGIPQGWTVNNISPCIINQASESITFVYSDGLFTPSNKIIDLSQHFTKDELLSVQPECEIIVTLLDKTDNVLASNYVWANDKTLGDVLNELGITKDVYDINVIITNVNAPEDNGYYYYYMLDETEPTEPFVEKDWMRIVSLEDDNTISLSKDIQYSVNGDDWKKLYANNTIIVNSNDIIYFKGTNTENQFTVNKAFNVEGNIMSLLYGDDFEGQIDLNGKNYAFYKLFYGCTTLQNVENLILPATTLTDSCYLSMFYGCTSLTEAPSLPATTLAQYCYSSMFYDCTSLTTAPSLPATTLAQGCYNSMFNGCKALTSAPLLPATTLADSCYNSMFSQCTSLTTAPQLPTTNLNSLCYYNMFNGCTSLTSAPELPATRLAFRCYYQMFYGCSKLNYIKMLATEINSSECLYNWVYGVASSGTFVKNANMRYLTNGVSGIPNGWTVETAYK